MRRIRWSVAPYDATPLQRRNFLNVQIDAVAIGLASAASPFLPVFLTRLGATNFQVGLITSLPGITGLILAIFIGRFLQSRRNIVPWFSASRLLFISSYAAAGLAAFIVPQQYLVQTILIIWGLATIPQTALAVCFSVVMNAVAGANHRYFLMSRRWSILGLTNAITVFLVGQILERIQFPINYQAVFIGLSLAGFVSYYYSNNIKLPDNELPAKEGKKSLSQQVRDYFQLIFSQPDFINFSVKRALFITGTMLSMPLFPLYLVREVQASDAWIGALNTIQTAVLLIGYLFWARASQVRGSRFVLLWTTLGLGLYPALVALTKEIELIAIFAGLAGVFQAGIDLVFFDELMKTVPEEHSAIFVSLAQSLNHAMAVVGPTLGTFLADQIGLSGALMVSTALRLGGFVLFLFGKPIKDVNKK